jgi:hypothetical protein
LALKQTPAVCSPSRSVVSNTTTRSETLDMTRSCGRGAARSGSGNFPGPETRNPLRPASAGEGGG